MSEKTKNEVLTEAEINAEAEMIREKKHSVKIIAVVGMSGSGKSVAVDYLTAKGIPKVYFGGMIYKEMERRGIARTEDGESEKKFREMIRETEGKDWVVRQVIDEVHDLIKAGQKRIVLGCIFLDRV